MWASTSAKCVCLRLLVFIGRNSNSAVNFNRFDLDAKWQSCRQQMLYVQSNRILIYLLLYSITNNGNIIATNNTNINKRRTSGNAHEVEKSTTPRILKWFTASKVSKAAVVKPFRFIALVSHCCKTMLQWLVDVKSRICRKKCHSHSQSNIEIELQHL